MATVTTATYTSALTVTMTYNPSGTGLADGGYHSSAALNNNSSTNYVDCLVGGAVRVGTLGATGGSISIYAYASYDGTEYTGGLDGADANITWGTTPSSSFVDGFQALPLLGVIGTENADDDKVIRWGPFSIAQAFGGTVPPKWGVVIRNSTGASFHATQTGAECQYTGVTFTST